jgi:hypothetical protein
LRAGNRELRIGDGVWMSHSHASKSPFPDASKLMGKRWDTSTYGRRTRRTNIELSISVLLHEALDPMLTGRQPNKRKFQDKNTTFPNIQCCALIIPDMGSNTYTTYGRPPTRPSAVPAKGHPIPRLVWGIAIQEDLHCGSYFSLPKSAPIFFPQGKYASANRERMRRVRKGTGAQIEDRSESKIMNEKLGNYNSFSRKIGQSSRRPER